MIRIGILVLVNKLLCPVVLLLGLISPTVCQTSTPNAQPTPSPKPTPSLEKEFFRNILKDQAAIWTSPFHVTQDQAKYLIPIGLTSAALIATDRRSADGLGRYGGNESRVKWSLRVSRLGSAYSSVGIATTFYLIGVAKHNSRARETGILMGEALINAQIVTTALKGITQRPRPLTVAPDDDFFDGGNSFPSGHATSAWAMAAVVASEYHDRKAVQITAYALASAVSLSRYTGRVHFLSDVFVGSAIGYGIGRFVYRRHHRVAGNDHGGQLRSDSMQSAWIPYISPIYSGSDRAYGVALTWAH